MWPFRDKQKQKPETVTVLRSEELEIPIDKFESENEGITFTNQKEIITHRFRSKEDLTKLKILKALLDIIGSEDIDSMFVTMLEEMRKLGYNLQGEPEALLEELKRQYA
jgi:hypothetical protein